MDRVAVILKEQDMQSFRQIAERAADFGIAPKSVNYALDGLRDAGRARVVNGRCYGRWIALPLLLLLTGCAGLNTHKNQQSGVVFPDISVPEPESQLHKIAALPALPQLNAIARSSAAPVKTNGVVTLLWTNGEPAETTILNLTTGIKYEPTTLEHLTVGGLPIGSTQTFIATNNAGSSLPASTVVTPDTMRLQVQTWLYLTWPGPAGTLQQTTNMVIWQDVAPIGANGSFIVTNQLKRGEFYRVKL